MITVTLFSRDNCHLCEQAKQDLESLQEEIPHRMVEVAIDGNRELILAYGLDVPVVEVGPYRLKAPMTRDELRVTLGAAADRANHLKSIDAVNYEARLQRGWEVSSADRFTYWLSNHYMSLFNLFVFMYVGLPVIAPLLMSVGWFTPARFIYRIYGTVCHQFAFRSWFLFGDQLAYPRAAAGIDGFVPYGQATGLDESDVWAAREFIGNSTTGFKVALCQRDVAIYGGILIFGLMFSLTGRRINSLPWYLWVMIGIVPIGLDGVSQIISQPPLNSLLPSGLLPFRESTPLLRTITGAMFGATTAWFGYPLVEESMVDTRQFLASKIARIKGAISQPIDH